MQWQDVRAHFPNQWVIMEATKAHSENSHWVVEDMSVVEAFSDSVKMMRAYSDLHRASPGKDIFFFHTSRDQIDIVEEIWLGPRV